MSELTAATAIVAGLAALLAGVHVSTAPPVLTDGDLALLVPVIGGGLGLLVLVALRSSAALRTVLLGCSAGVAFGTTAALVRLLTHRIASDGAAGLIGWATPVVAATAVVGLLLEQAAYKSGHLGVAVAGYTVTDPLVAVAVGAWLLHQPAQAAHPLLLVAEAIVVVAGVVMLARKTAAPTTVGFPPPDRGPAAQPGAAPAAYSPRRRIRSPCHRPQPSNGIHESAHE